MPASRRFRDKTQTPFAGGAGKSRSDSSAPPDTDDDDPEDDTAGYGGDDDDDDDDDDDSSASGDDADDDDGTADDPDADDDDDDDDDAPAPAGGIAQNRRFPQGNRSGFSGRDNAAFAPRGKRETMSKGYNSENDEDEGAIAVVQGEEFIKGIRMLIKSEIKSGIAAVLAGGENDLAATVRDEVRKAVAPMHTLVKSLMDDNDAFQDHIDDRFDKSEVASAELSKSVSNLLSGANLVKGVGGDGVPPAPVNPSALTPAPRGAATSAIAKGVVPGSAVPGGSGDLRSEAQSLMAKAEGIQERLHKAVPGMTDMIFALSSGAPITEHMVSELRSGVSGAE